MVQLSCHIKVTVSQQTHDPLALGILSFSKMFLICLCGDCVVDLSVGSGHPQSVVLCILSSLCGFLLWSLFAGEKSESSTDL